MRRCMALVAAALTRVQLDIRHVRRIFYFSSGAISWKHFRRHKLGSSVAEVVGEFKVKQNGPFPAPGL